MTKIPYGYCHCGCGQKTNLATTTRNERGDIKGHPIKYIKGHRWWKGGKTHLGGAVRILQYGHPNAKWGGYVFEHVLIMEKALRRHLLQREVVHHIDGDRSNNYIGNLILFKNQSMHAAYHHRLKAFKESGNYEWRQCCFCHKWDDPENMINWSPRGMCHFSCSAEYDKKRIRHRGK